MTFAENISFFDHFTDFLGTYYLTLKFFHLLGVFCWMAGLFYLPRIFVYHTECGNEDARKVLDVMAYKLYSFIMQPAMLISVLFGILLFSLPHNRFSGWVHLKFTCALGLIMFQYFLNRCRLSLAARKSTKSGYFFRLINEIPTLALIIILICVIFKPF
jgi:putative membrane protein